MARARAHAAPSAGHGEQGKGYRILAANRYSLDPVKGGKDPIPCARQGKNARESSRTTIKRTRLNRNVLASLPNRTVVSIPRYRFECNSWDADRRPSSSSRMFVPQEDSWRQNSARGQALSHDRCRDPPEGVVAAGQGEGPAATPPPSGDEGNRPDAMLCKEVRGASARLPPTAGAGGGPYETITVAEPTAFPVTSPPFPSR